ncbi:ribose-5-phosphate isomerase A [Candidatus Woesearchaeota archaeon]|nr:ribose-5-phosphate isomerase A [Candidatus Woesearchaeota archaeon]
MSEPISPEEQWPLIAEKALEEIVKICPGEANTLVFGTGRTVTKTLELFFKNGHYNTITQIGFATEGLYKKALEFKKQYEAEDLAIGLYDTEARIKTLNGHFMGVDGADQLDPNGNAFKGGQKVKEIKPGVFEYICLGKPWLEGSMKREKSVLYRAKKVIYLVDSSKQVEYLGKNDYCFPIEFDQAYTDQVVDFLERKGFKIDLSSDIRRVTEADGQIEQGNIFVSENGYHILDLEFDGRKYTNEELIQLERDLEAHPYIHSVGLVAVRKPDVVVYSDIYGKVSVVKYSN